MDSELQRQQRIENYLTGSLSQEEAILFEKEMEQNADVIREVREYMKVRTIAYGQSKEEHKKELDQLFDAQENESTKKSNHINKNLIYIMAAALALVLLIVGINYWQAPHRKPEKWALSYATPITVPEIRSQAPGNILNKAGVAFNKKEYATAIDLYKQALNIDSLKSDPDIHFYLGQAYLFTQQPDTAISQLQMAANYPEEAEWYSALAKLYQGEIEVSRSAFEKISRVENHAFQKEAIQILNDFP